jgi:hypothetical protein
VRSSESPAEQGTPAEQKSSVEKDGLAEFEVSADVLANSESTRQLFPSW